ncbi:hypothetical protein [Pedobacter sp.]|jgi:hypothetical protein|uniref:hypothetical protein n=1 Tax=Pedobacter sp. TaxID=1411316 RepID=UPI002B7585A1|nr:hypothetical protein [Pedobacter sp.]HWW39653.1 hypothetical protein [Pedobacter sp.]
MTIGRLTKLIESIDYRSDEKRNYIGASSIGSDCLRQIWYEFKNADGEIVTNKLKRTFDIGKQLEQLVFSWLTLSNVKFVSHQLQYEDEELLYFQGHIDGFLPELEAILEIKTAKDSSFKGFVKDGLKKWSLRYYAQLQSYMGMSGFHKAYILVLNKDNSDIWDEMITFDETFYLSLREKAKMVYEAVIPPLRVNNSPLWYQCKMCKFNRVCHE